jgi:SAM-dependent methyltransferase
VIAEFDDPRLAAIYDTVNAYGPGEQPDYYAALARDVDARFVLDVGCGTGMVSAALAARGFEVIGVDPSPAMLGVARARRSASGARFVEGGVDALGECAVDLAFMSGHVAQFFVDDGAWAGALRAVRDALDGCGYLAFESRNPLVREWERWTPAHRRVVHDERAGAVETWSDVRAVHDGVVDYANHYRMLATGDELVSEASLRFRTRDELTASLHDAGFTVERIDGDWDGRPATDATRELIVVGRGSCALQ